MTGSAGATAAAAIKAMIGAVTATAALSGRSAAPPAAPTPPGAIRDDDMALGHRLRAMPDMGTAPAGPAPVAPAPAVPTPAAPTPEPVAVLVVGAGIAGLAAARALRRAGIDDYLVLDLGDRPGGNSRWTRVAGLPCATGAHYLPLPGPSAVEVIDLLTDLGVRDGGGNYDERMLIQAPHERLLIHGVWQDGLLPLVAQPRSTIDQYRRFAERLAALQQTTLFTIPVARAGRPDPVLQALTFARWLDDEGFDAPGLRWYLDYCCRDDYGAGIATVSAWAGLHYFASRHGFALPEAVATGARGADTGPNGREAMLTWPQGNGWLADRMAAPHAGRIAARHLVTTIERSGSGRDGRWQVDAIDFSDRSRPRSRRWLADVVVCAAPVHVAATIVRAPGAESAWLTDAARRLRSAAWLVANVVVDARWRPSGGELAWDNVIHGSDALGYVNARQQRVDRRDGPALLTWYQALGDDPGAPAWLATRSFDALAGRCIADLSRAHPEIGARVREVAIHRHGHAMAIPTPAAHGSAGLERLREATGDLLFAHSDLSHYSIFEEAMERGMRAGRLASARLRGR
ncbi:MAG: FAD-dependent oxidoreductase [Burkholderiaceae bacterium]